MTSENHVICMDGIKMELYLAVTMVTLNTYTLFLKASDPSNANWIDTCTLMVFNTFPSHVFLQLEISGVCKQQAPHSSSIKHSMTKSLLKERSSDSSIDDTFKSPFGYASSEHHKWNIHWLGRSLTQSKDSCLSVKYMYSLSVRVQHLIGIQLNLLYHISHHKLHIQFTFQQFQESCQNWKADEWQSSN